MALQPTLSPTTVRWNTHFGHPADTAPVSPSEFDYLLDGDDPVARAARSRVLILGGAA